jgi:hypothetical protein
MSKPRPFLNTPHGAYFARGVPPPDDELVRVGPGTPCGEYLRSFWQPVAFARDLLDVPLRIRIMSEDGDLPRQEVAAWTAPASLRTGPLV